MGREHRHGMLSISLQIKELLLISSVYRIIYFFFFFLGPENVSYFLHKICLMCHLGAPSGTLLNPAIKSTYLTYARLVKYASSFCCVNWHADLLFLLFFFFLSSSLGAECQSWADWGGRTLASLVRAWLPHLCSTGGTARPGAGTLCCTRVPRLTGIGLPLLSWLSSPFLWYSYSQESEREASSVEEGWLFQWQFGVFPNNHFSCLLDVVWMRIRNYWMSLLGSI